MSGEGITSDDFDWVKIGFWTAVAFVYFFAYKHFYPDAKYFISHPLAHIVVVFFLVSGLGIIIWRSRYKANQVCVNGISGSIYGKPEPVSDPTMGEGFTWAVFNLGFSMLPPLRGKLATLVVPWNQIYPAGKNYVGLTLVQKKPLESLPFKVVNFLRHNAGDFNLENVYFGQYSQEFIDNSGYSDDGKSELDLLSTIESQNTLLTQLQKIVEGKFDSFEELKELADRVSGKGGFKKFLKRVSLKQDDDE